MNEPPPHSLSPAITAPPVIRATIDQLSTIRYIHAQSLRAAVLNWAGEEEVQAYTAHVYAPAYSRSIETAIGAGRCLAALIDHQIVGTCGWSPVEDGNPVARVRWSHVLPLYGRMGIGRRLLAAVETAAEDEGYKTFVARSTPHAVGFFEHAGYGVTAHGTRILGKDCSVPITYLRKSLIAPVAATYF